MFSIWRMIQSDLHSDMQESIQVRSLSASRATRSGVDRNIMNGPKVGKLP